MLTEEVDGEGRSGGRHSWKWEWKKEDGAAKEGHDGGWLMTEAEEGEEGGEGGDVTVAAKTKNREEKAGDGGEVKRKGEGVERRKEEGGVEAAVVASTVALGGDTGEGGEEESTTMAEMRGEEGKKKEVSSARSRCRASACVECDGVPASIARHALSRTHVAMSAPPSFYLFIYLGYYISPR